MWFDDEDIGGRGVVLPAQGPLGRAMRKARLAVYLSQEQLANIGGVNQSAVSRLERGAPSWRLFCRLVAAIGGEPIVTVAELPTRAATLAAANVRTDDYDWW